MTYSAFISCAIGLEPILEQELRQIIHSGSNDSSAKNTVAPISLKLTKAGVSLNTDIETIYRIAMWSRVASRVLLPMFDAPANAEGLYDKAFDFDWSQWLKPDAALDIKFSGKNDDIRHSQFGAYRIKDAIVDWHNQKGLQPPHLAQTGIEVRLSARLQRQTVSVALDLSGDAMHIRGYRQRQGDAPIRENLAASLLYRAGWPAMAAQSKSFFDPMCGSGTLVIEAAMMACDMAPGLKRDHWGFQHWPQHQDVVWRRLCLEAKARAVAGKQNYQGEITGTDILPHMVHMSRDNASRAAVLENMKFLTGDATRIHKADLFQNDDATGLILTNPPYGERLGDPKRIGQLLTDMGTQLVKKFPNWRAGILFSDKALGKDIALHSYKQYQFTSGKISIWLMLFELQTNNVLNQKQHTAPSEGARMVENRLKKNHQKLKTWIAQESIQAYRLYDADIPEYAAAIDVYHCQDATYARIQEYAPPKTVDAGKAKHRLNEIQTAVALALQLPDSKVILKTRQKQKGTSQYQSESEGNDFWTKKKQTDKHPVSQQQKLRQGKHLLLENNAMLAVDMTQYLDTGLFLDHRPMRREIAKQARGKSLLNLFCYTATATAQAAVSGARGSLSVDMSNTYLDWARYNFELNNIDQNKHRLLSQDCLQFLKYQAVRQSELFDLIFLDPPSFSNSKKMQDVLDIQRDHVELITQAITLLETNGTLFFSTNLRSFKLDDSALSSFNIQPYVQQSFDPDFQRNQRLHHCWLIKHA